MKSKKSIVKCWINFWKKTNFCQFTFVSKGCVICQFYNLIEISQRSIDEAGHTESTAVLEKLENIDSETDNLDITFVKMADARYARKWGVTKLPAIVYFRKRFPSIFRGYPYFRLETIDVIIYLFSLGDLMSEDEVLEWLRKNRFRQPELNIFMYALIAISIAFVLYTAFLLQCFKPPPPPPPQHPKQQ